jgi:plastocyanin
MIISCIALSSPVLPVTAYAEMDVTSTTGTIYGEVLISRKLAAQRMRFRLYPGFKPQPPPAGGESTDDERTNVVIYLKSTPAIAAIQAGSEAPQIKQKGETFIPHVLPVVQGTTVDFPNQDPIFHNVFSLSGTKSFDLGRYPKGESRSVTFDQTGIVPVFCHLHSNMSAIVLVLDNPFFSIPDVEGQYRIENIPAGTYTIVGWHERSEPVEQQVEVLPGQSVELNIIIPITDDEPSAP